MLFYLTLKLLCSNLKTIFFDNFEDLVRTMDDVEYIDGK